MGCVHPYQHKGHNEKDPEVAASLCRAKERGFGDDTVLISYEHCQMNHPVRPLLPPCSRAPVA